jgi:dodecin
MKNEPAVARITEIVSSSARSFDDAISTGFKRASKTLRGITGIKVRDHRCKVEDGKIVEYRVTIDILFVLET